MSRPSNASPRAPAPGGPGGGGRAKGLKDIRVDEEVKIAVNIALERFRYGDQRGAGPSASLSPSLSPRVQPQPPGPAPRRPAPLAPACAGLAWGSPDARSLARSFVPSLSPSASSVVLVLGLGLGLGEGFLPPGEPPSFSLHGTQTPSPPSVPSLQPQLCGSQRAGGTRIPSCSPGAGVSQWASDPIPGSHPMPEVFIQLL